MATAWEPRPVANAMRKAEATEWLQSIRPEAGLLPDVAFMACTGL